MVNVLASARVYDKQVGGNTRYARTVYDGIGAYGVDLSFARPKIGAEASRLRSASYAAHESLMWPLRPGKDIDVVHFPADTGAVVHGRTPVVGTIHGLATLHVARVRSSLSDRIWKARVARLAASSSKIITVSESSARDIASFAPSAAGSIRVIPHGIDHQRFHADRSIVDISALAELDLPDRYFLYLGNLDPRKNVIALAQAAHRVHAKTGIPLVVAGAPAWESDAILQTVSNTVGVQYVGRVAEEALLPLLQNALAFCFPSTYEGFGFPVLEAMASGTPVMCSGRGSLKEVAGEAALVIDGITARDIENAMLEIATDDALRADLRARGLANAATYSWDRSIAAHADLFREVAS